MRDSDIPMKIQEILTRHLGARYRLWLFGSRASGVNSPTADFDFLVDAGEIIPLERWRAILADIEELPTLFSIDVVDFRAADPAFLKSIEKDLQDVGQRRS